MKTLIAMILVVGCGVFGGTTQDLSRIFINCKTGTVIDCEIYLCAFIKETVTTNMTYFYLQSWIEDDGVMKEGSQNYVKMTDGQTADMAIKLVTQKKLLEFDYDGKRYTNEISSAVIASNNMRKVTTEEWVDE